MKKGRRISPPPPTHSSNYVDNDRGWGKSERTDYEYYEAASRFYADEDIQATTVVNTVFRKPKEYADLHEYDEFPVIDRVPTAIGFRSADSGDLIAEEKSKASRYSVDLRMKHKPRSTMDISDDEEDKYSLKMKRSEANSVWSESTDSCAPVWKSFSDDDQDIRGKELSKRVGKTRKQIDPMGDRPYSDDDESWQTSENFSESESDRESEEESRQPRERVKVTRREIREDGERRPETAWKEKEQRSRRQADDYHKARQGRDDRESRQAIRGRDDDVGVMVMRREICEDGERRSETARKEKERRSRHRAEDYHEARQGRGDRESRQAIRGRDDDVGSLSSKDRSRRSTNSNELSKGSGKSNTGPKGRSQRLVKPARNLCVESAQSGPVHSIKRSKSSDRSNKRKPLLTKVQHPRAPANKKPSIPMTATETTKRGWFTSKKTSGSLSGDSGKSGSKASNSSSQKNRFLPKISKNEVEVKTLSKVDPRPVPSRQSGEDGRRQVVEAEESRIRIVETNNKKLIKNEKISHPFSKKESPCESPSPSKDNKAGEESSNNSANKADERTSVGSGNRRSSSHKESNSKDSEQEKKTKFSSSTSGSQSTSQGSGKKHRKRDLAKKSTSLKRSPSADIVFEDPGSQKKPDPLPDDPSKSKARNEPTHTSKVANESAEPPLKANGSNRSPDLDYMTPQGSSFASALRTASCHADFGLKEPLAMLGWVFGSTKRTGTLSDERIVDENDWKRNALDANKSQSDAVLASRSVDLGNEPEPESEKTNDLEDSDDKAINEEQEKVEEKDEEIENEGPKREDGTQPSNVNRKQSKDDTSEVRSKSSSEGKRRELKTGELELAMHQGSASDSKTLSSSKPSKQTSKQERSMDDEIAAPLTESFEEGSRMSGDRRSSRNTRIGVRYNRRSKSPITQVKSLELDGARIDESDVRQGPAPPQVVDVQVSRSRRDGDDISISTIEIPTPDVVLQADDDGSVSILGLDRSSKNSGKRKPSSSAKNTTAEVLTALQEKRSVVNVPPVETSNKKGKSSFMGKLLSRKKSSQ